MARTTKNALAEVVGVAGVLKAQPMSDQGNQKGVEGVRRNPKKRYGVYS